MGHKVQDVDMAPCPYVACCNDSVIPPLTPCGQFHLFLLMLMRTLQAGCIAADWVASTSNGFDALCLDCVVLINNNNIRLNGTHGAIEFSPCLL
ncbi:unnamed protein product, partial [Nesidiocoris tenuis]